MARTRYRSLHKVLPWKDLPAAALRAVWREGYGGPEFRRDLLAGVVVGIVALPLAMALAIAVGVPPQYGLYTSIVAGAVIAFLGGSRTQVSGPTAAFIVILAPIYARFGFGGLLLSGMLGGIFLILMGLARFGKFIQFIPHPVTTGFTAGIGTVIATLQLKDLFGLRLSGTPEHFLERVVMMVRAWPTTSGWELLVGLATLGVLIGLPRVTKRLPAALVALPVAALLTAFLVRAVPGASVATIASRFRTPTHGGLISGIPRLPPMPMWPWNAGGPDGRTFVLSFGLVRELLASGFAVAMLGAIESLLSAVVADGMAGTRHDPDAELIAQGVGNVIAPFFGGIPATGAIARTATNIRSGARSPVAAIVHSLTILLAILVLAPLIGYLPMAGLAALLLLVAWNMSEAKHFLHIVRVAPRADVIVLLTCYGLTVFFDMVIAISVGVMMAALMFMQRMSLVTRARLAEGAPDGFPRALPPGTVAYDIAGPLFFGAAERAMSTLGLISSGTRAAILRMEQVPVVDATGLVALESALANLNRDGVTAIVTGLPPEPLAIFLRAQIPGRYPNVRVVANVEEALILAESLLSAQASPGSRRAAGEEGPGSG